MQSWDLDRKIRVTQTRIIEWMLRYDNQVYVSFSGGKDSTVLLDIARRVDESIKAVFVDTGLEFPEIREFVKTMDNVEWLHPIKYDRKKQKWVRTSYKEVIEAYGYPVVSKEQAAFIHEYRDTKSDKLKDIRWNGNKHGLGKISEKWKFLVDAPFKISDKCCDVMKKKPSYIFEKETGLRPIIGTTADESVQRLSNWLMYGCNAFEKSRPTSQPLSFWTEQDILRYLVETKVPYSKIYGDIVKENGIFRCTGEPRTGCITCMFGCHLEKEPNKFQRMKITHPKRYNYCINGLKQGEVLDYIGVKY